MATGKLDTQDGFEGASEVKRDMIAATAANFVAYRILDRDQESCVILRAALRL